MGWDGIGWRWDGMAWDGLGRMREEGRKRTEARKKKKKNRTQKKGRKKEEGSRERREPAEQGPALYTPPPDRPPQRQLFIHNFHKLYIISIIL